MQVVFKVKVDPLLLYQAGTAPPRLPPTPADDPKHVDQLVPAQFHLKGNINFLMRVCDKCQKENIHWSEKLFSKGA